MKKSSSRRESRTLGLSSDFCSEGAAGVLTTLTLIDLTDWRIAGSNDWRKLGVALRTLGISSGCSRFAKSLLCDLSVVSVYTSFLKIVISLF